jgi:hypothetical protein
MRFLGWFAYVLRHVVLAATAAGPIAMAQCSNLWLPGAPQVRNIAGLDPTTGQWMSFDSGIDGPATALMVLAKGERIAGGDFALGDVLAGGVFPEVAGAVSVFFARRGRFLLAEPSPIFHCH